MSFLRPLARLAPPLVLLFTFCLTAAAQAPTASVVMLSDVHFDPFHDPGKLTQLRAEPIERWPAILNQAPSATAANDLQTLQSECNSRALDTSWPLFQQALAAAHQAQPRPAFVTLSGDLLTHEFSCRFGRLAAGSTPDDLATFAAKTVSFVLAQTRQAFPRNTVFGTLGNNDSGCGDYRATSGDAFLSSVSPQLAKTAAAGNGEQTTPEGDYSVPMPAPMQHARLIVLSDIFEARQYATCAGAADRSAEARQMDWLRAQLKDARAHGEHVWVMAHIPSGIDVYTSFRRYVLRPAELCSADERPFLADTSLPDALLEYSDVVRLALFGHTHMDEFRVLHRDAPQTAVTASQVATNAGSTVPAKIVPSVTPWAGNHPAFLVASVDPRTAVLKDWRTIVSPGADAATPPWTEAYRFTAAYHLPDFSAASALKLADTFTGDKAGQNAASAAFREHFYPGDFGMYAMGLTQIWPAYACTVRNDRPSAIRQCICGTASAVPAGTPGQP